MDVSKFRTNHRGFTLIEMMVVVFIIGLLTVILLPRLMVDTQRALLSEVKRFQTLFQHAEAESILSGQMLAIQFDLQGKQYQLLKWEALLNEEESQNEEKKTKNQMELLSKVFRLPSQFDIDFTQLDENLISQSSDNKSVITFSPIGMISEFELTFKGEDFLIELSLDEFGDVQQKIVDES